MADDKKNDKGKGKEDKAEPIYSVLQLTLDDSTVVILPMQTDNAVLRVILPNDGFIELPATEATQEFKHLCALLKIKQETTEFTMPDGRTLQSSRLPIKENMKIFGFILNARVLSPANYDIKDIVKKLSDEGWIMGTYKFNRAEMKQELKFSKQDVESILKDVSDAKELLRQIEEGLPEGSSSWSEFWTKRYSDHENLLQEDEYTDSDWEDYTEEESSESDELEQVNRRLEEVHLIIQQRRERRNCMDSIWPMRFP